MFILLWRGSCSWVVVLVWRGVVLGSECRFDTLEVTVAVGCPCGCVKFCPQEVLLSKYARKWLYENSQRSA